MGWKFDLKWIKCDEIAMVFLFFLFYLTGQLFQPKFWNIFSLTLELNIQTFKSYSFVT